MAPSNDKKAERTSAKWAITLVTKHMKTGCEYNMGSVGEIVSKLDTALCDFVEIATE